MPLLAANRTGTLGERLCRPGFGARATCAVVALRLDTNGLSGRLAYVVPLPTGSGIIRSDGGSGDGLCLLSHLEVLSVSANALTGRLPLAPTAAASSVATSEAASEAASAIATLSDTARQAVPGPGTGADSCLPSLHSLNIERNLLGGELPEWVLASATLSSLRVSDNRFVWPASELVALCFGRNGRPVACSGVPPMSCRAFGDQWRLQADSPNECVPCTLPAPWPLVMLVGVLGAFLLFGGTYAAMMLLRPGSLKHLFSTIGILIAHLQTLTIVGNLRLAWPRSAHTVMSFMVVNGLQLEAVRPECVFESADGEAELPWFYIFGFAKIALPLSLLLSLSLTRWTLQLAFRSRLRRASLGTETPSERTESLMAKLDKLEVRRTISPRM